GRRGAAGARGTLRPVRHRRRDERVDPAGARSGEHLARRCARPDRGAPRRAATREARRAVRCEAAFASCGGTGRDRRTRRHAESTRGGAAARESETEAEIRQPQDPALMRVRIVGGGLAGSEAAWQAASRGVPVTLYEMRPVRPTAVHKTDRLAEL